MGFSYNTSGVVRGSEAIGKKIPITTISWAGTSSPALTTQPLNFNELTITWAGTSSPSLNVT